eukprot:scaffold614_cov367-Prasinococcus_capsulatus_cf.AAC.15
MGYHTYGRRHLPDVAELIRREVERCDHMGGLLLLQSMAGGTGAGERKRLRRPACTLRRAGRSCGDRVTGRVRRGAPAQLRGLALQKWRGHRAALQHDAHPEPPGASSTTCRVPRTHVIIA